MTLFWVVYFFLSMLCGQRSSILFLFLKKFVESLWHAEDCDKDLSHIISINLPKQPHEVGNIIPILQVHEQKWC